ncbi:parB-like partition protein [Xylanimonas cellulosilytica DSM 15894]|uniref:ParB-like partition protein n=1 Tax=Xylanimonas cellulosilytica (strain DSM 15894 / JCM 12276 / CECT 5975 / KCTC 9989 / LMG 20990 / NBRC 107835 / XIL07) TaxID=446471 RepID=D1BRV5_XYLCX|nr:parB-like partition protein [Xylanimonas cellulosilytica DSM 15894]
MSAQKKRGLGRGLGALIPSGPEGDRPVDVFFPSGDRAEQSQRPKADGSDSALTASDGKASAGSGRSMSWDAAMSSGRLAIRTNGTARPVGEQSDDAVTSADANGGTAMLGGAALAVAAARPDLSGRTDSTSGADAIATADATASAGTGGASAGLTAETVVVDDESSSSDPTDVSVVTGSIAAVGESLATVTPIASVRVPHDALASRGATDAVINAAFSRIDGVSRETATGAPAALTQVKEPANNELMAADDLLPVPGASFAELPVDAIRPNTWQPRTVFDESELDELVDSIKEIGVLQPIVVRPDRSGDGQYELIMGERRWRATQLAGLATVPAIIRETDDSDMLRDALLENLHRAQLNPLEEAAAYRQLLDDFGCTHEELATRIARSRPQISNTLRLLKLPPLVQRRVAAGILSAGHARALLSLSDGAEIERLAQRIVSEGLSVRATEEIVALVTSGGEEAKRRTPRAGQRSVAVDELAGRLSDLFETRVKVQVGKSKGRMTVEFASVEDLNRILAVMAPQDPGILKQ